MGRRDLSLRLYTALANASDPQSIAPQPLPPPDIQLLVRLLAALTATNPAWPPFISADFLADLAVKTLNRDQGGGYDVPKDNPLSPAQLWRDWFKRDRDEPNPWPIALAPRTRFAGSAEFLLAEHWEALFEIRSRHDRTVGLQSSLPVSDRDLIQGPAPSPGLVAARRYLIGAFELDPQRVAHLFALGALYQDAWLVRRVLQGGIEPRPDHLLGPTQLRLSERRIVEEDRESPLFRPCLRDFLREDPFPLAACESCVRLFAIPRRGKPPRYCSARCRSRGIPSAALRDEYMRRYRKKKADEELSVANALLTGRPVDDIARIRRRFPEKTHRQLLNLLRRAEASTQKGKHKENSK